MTIQELVEKLRDESMKRMKKGAEPNGTFKLLKFWHSEMQKCRRTDELKMYHHKIEGLIDGVYGTYLITDQEYEQLNDELKKIYNERMEKTI